MPDTKFSATIDGAAVELSVVMLPFYHAETSKTKARKLYEEALQIFAKEDEQEHGDADRQ